jgi:hypothetical protein
MDVNTITVFISSDGVIYFYFIRCLLLFLCDDDDDDDDHFSLIDDVHESNYLIHTVLLFVGRKMKVINLEVYIYYIQRGEEEKKAQMNNQSSIDRFPTVNNNTFCL